MKMKLTRNILVVIFGFLLLFAVAKSDEDTQDPENDAEADEDSDTPDVEVDNDVLVLTEDNFDDVVFSDDDKTPILVEFYAPWCGHCKSLAPKFEAAAAKLKVVDYPVRLAKVDATEHSALGQRFDVSGYPTLKWFKDGQTFDYDGGREEDDIVQFMSEKADPNYKPPPEQVIALTTDTFDDFINEHELSLVEFYAPWCGHCKKLAPEYEKAAKQLITRDPPIPLAKVDATEEADLGKKYDVSGYPTLKLFRKGTEFEYKGGRDLHGIVSYMDGQAGDPSKEQTSLKQLKKYMNQDDITVVGFFNSEDDKAYQLYQEAANGVRDDYKFAHTFDADIRSQYKINAGSVAVFNAERFYSKFESKWNVKAIKEDTKASDILSFLDGHSIPLVGQLTSQSREKRYTGKRPLVVVFYTVDFGFDYRQVTQMWREKIVKIAKEYRDMTFAIADEEGMSDLFKDFGFIDSGEEMNIGILNENDKRFPMEPMEEFDADEIKSFIAAYKKGKISPQIKSQPEPKKQAVVKTVVGKTFQKIVNDPSKDVLIELYAPWCGHCKSLEPIYKDLAKKYKKNKKLVIAKMDATANDMPDNYEASGFPTIYFAPAKDKANPVKFEGARDLDGFTTFLEEKATFSLGLTKEEL